MLLENGSGGGGGGSGTDCVAGYSAIAPAHKATEAPGLRPDVALNGSVAQTAKYEGLAADVPSIIGYSGMSWGKAVQDSAALDSRGLLHKETLTRTENSSALAKGKCAPERPAPLYPISFKNHGLPPALVSPPNVRRLETPHQARTPLSLPTPNLPLPPAARASLSSVASGANGTPSAAAAASAFFRRAFPASSMPGFNPASAPPGIPTTPAGTPFAGIPASAASFMSLAQFLFQPKYPLGKKTFRCHECRYITDRKNNLKRHVATMHQDCGKFLECCDTIFHSKAALRDHVLMYHRTGYKCRFCGRNFCRKALLKRHLTVHNGQKEFICEVCDYATSHKSNLERHRKVHGLGSPIGSEDGDQFLQDGPDASVYNYKHPHNDAVDTDDADSSRLEFNGRETFVDVETLNADSYSDKDMKDQTLSGEGASDMIDTAGPASPVEDVGPSEQPPSVVIAGDPLLEAFKPQGRKGKGKVYLTDRLRQTHESDKGVILSSKYDHRPATEEVGEEDTKYQEEGDKTAVCRVETERPTSEAGGYSPVAPQRPRSCDDSPRDGPSPSETVKPERTSEAATGMNKGCRRLYASPYKCSECGAGLPSQQILLEHSMACRKQGVEPSRPINTLSADYRSELSQSTDALSDKKLSLEHPQNNRDGHPFRAFRPHVWHKSKPYDYYPKYPLPKDLSVKNSSENESIPLFRSENPTPPTLQIPRSISKDYSVERLIGQTRPYPITDYTNLFRRMRDRFDPNDLIPSPSAKFEHNPRGVPWTFSDLVHMPGTLTTAAGLSRESAAVPELSKLTTDDQFGLAAKPRRQMEGYYPPIRHADPRFLFQNPIDLSHRYRRLDNDIPERRKSLERSDRQGEESKALDDGDRDSGGRRSPADQPSPRPSVEDDIQGPSPATSPVSVSPASNSPVSNTSDDLQVLPIKKRSLHHLK